MEEELDVVRGYESLDYNDVGVSSNSQRESTSEDYWNTLNPSGMAYNNPQLAFNASTDIRGAFDYDAPEFQDVYGTADIGTKRAMLNANNTSDALKIAERRGIFVESQKAIEEDGLGTQLVNGILPAIASPTSLLPFGAVLKTAKIGSMAARLTKNVATGAGVGAVANIADEALFDLQGMPTNYVGAGVIGATFGGFLGGLTGVLSGPSKTTSADAMLPEKDSFTKDYTNDPDFNIKVDEDGVVQLQDVGQMDKSLTDRIPFIGKMLRSDVHTVYQSDNSVLRGWMARMSSATTSLRDNSGNILPINRTGQDFKRQTKGLHNNLTKDLQESFGEARQVGYKGNEEQYSKDVWELYTQKMNIQKSEATAYANQVTSGAEAEVTTMKKSLKEQSAKDLEVANTPEVFFRDAEGKQQPMTEELIGTIPEDKLVFKKNKDTVKAAEEKIAADTEALSIEIKSKHDDAMNTWYENNSFDFDVSNPIGKGANAQRKYFSAMLKRSQETGIKELQGIHTNKLYAPRTYNFRAIKTGKVKQEIVEGEVRAGLSNEARNQGMTKEQLDSATAGIVQMLNSTAFDLNNLNTSFLVKNLPFETNLKQQKLYLNETFMPNILVSNMNDLTGAYHYKMSGRQSVQYAFGTDDLTEIMDGIKSDFLSKGVIDTGEDVAAFERTLQDLVGNLRMNQLADTPSWTFTRNLASFNSARLGGGFGGNQFIELASAVMMNGVQALVSGRMMKSLKNSSDLLFTKNNNQDEFANYLIGSGYMEDALHTSRVNRYADTEAGFNSGALENSLNWMNDKLMKYNGMRYFMGVMEDYTGSTIVTQLKKGSIDAKRLARWGLSESQGSSLGAKLKEVDLEGGWDISKLSVEEQDLLQLAISRGIDEVVVQGDSIHLPAWMKAPGQFTKVLTQFMRFPLIAQEALLRKGMKEEQAQLIAGTLGSISAYIGMKYLREQAGLATGLVHPIDSKYDYENYDSEDWQRVVGESLNYTAPLGFMSSVYNYGAIATGNNELGREWQSKNGMSSLLGPSGGLGEDLIQLIRAGVNGEITDERNLSRFKSMTPFMNLPLLNEGGKYLIEEYGR